MLWLGVPNPPKLLLCELGKLPWSVASTTAETGSIAAVGRPPLTVACQLLFNCCLLVASHV